MAGAGDYRRLATAGKCTERFYKSNRGSCGEWAVWREKVDFLLLGAEINGALAIAI